MPIRNVVFDVGGVLLEWDPPSVIARLHPDAATQATIRRQMFEHPDWHEFDRGTYSESQAAVPRGCDHVGTEACSMTEVEIESLQS